MTNTFTFHPEFDAAAERFRIYSEATFSEGATDHSSDIMSSFDTMRHLVICYPELIDLANAELTAREVKQLSTEQIHAKKCAKAFFTILNINEPGDPLICTLENPVELLASTQPTSSSTQPSETEAIACSLENPETFSPETQAWIDSGAPISKLLRD